MWARIVKFVCFLVAALVSLAPAAAAPQRIVSTFLCTDEYLFRLVPRERISALSYLAGDKVTVVSTIVDQVGDILLIRPSAESVVALEPDLVLMYANTNPRLKTALDRAHIPLVEVPWANSFADIRNVTHMLGEKLGAEDRAQELLAGMDEKIADVRSRAVGPPVSTLLYETNGYASIGGVTEEAMKIAGLSNAAPQFHMTRMGTIPVEEVITAVPDLLILGGRQDEANTRADMVLRHPALSALKDRTTMEWAALTPLVCPGPWSAQAVETFGALGRLARAAGRP